MKKYINDIEKLAKARGISIDGMLARDIAEYIREELHAADMEAQEAAEDSADKMADAIEEAAAEFVGYQAQAGGEYYKKDLRQFLGKIADALGYTPAYGQAERIENMQLLTY